MAIEITDSKGNLLPEDDPDQLTEEERKALEAEGIEVEDKQPAKEPEKEPEKEPDRPEQNYVAENKRLREQRDRLRAQEQQQMQELQRLREENAKLQARRDFQREEADRLKEADLQSKRPDANEDPYGAEMWDMKQSIKEQKEVIDRFKQQEEQQRQWQEQFNERQQSERRIKIFLDNDVATFKQSHPDVPYEEVANFVYQKHIDFWQKRGLTRQEADQHAAAMFMGLAFTAEQRGGSPAEAVVELAKDHFGWKPKAAAEPLPPDDSKGVDLNKAKEKIARIKKGQALQGLGGTKNSQRDPMENVAGLTDEDLAALSDDEYVALKQDKTAGRILNKRLEELG